MNMLGLIFADKHNSDIGELTSRRTFAALPFGARYRIIDFFISNMTNSGVRNIGVVATTKYESLMGHVRYGGEWDLDRRKSGIIVLPPFSFFSGEVRYENILEALQANIAYIRESSEPYVLFTCCDAIGNIDYAAMLEKHIETGARFTCLCTPNPINNCKRTDAGHFHEHAHLHHGARGSARHSGGIHRQQKDQPAQGCPDAGSR